MSLMNMKLIKITEFVFAMTVILDLHIRSSANWTVLHRSIQD